MVNILILWDPFGLFFNINTKFFLCESHEIVEGSTF